MDENTRMCPYCKRWIDTYKYWKNALIMRFSSSGEHEFYHVVCWKRKLLMGM